jgi:Gas vesicle protein G
VIILDTLLIGGLRFVLEKLAAAVEAERDDDTTLREELLAAQMRLEVGEIGEAEYARVEAVLLRRIAEIRERREGESSVRGALRVTGADVTFTGDEEETRADDAARTRGAKPRSRRRR